MGYLVLTDEQIEVLCIQAKYYGETLAKSGKKIGDKAVEGLMNYLEEQTEICFALLPDEDAKAVLSEFNRGYAYVKAAEWAEKWIENNRW